MGRTLRERTCRPVRDRHEASHPGRLFAAMVGQWTEEFGRTGFDRGCPVAAATVDCAESVASTRAAAAAAFDTWRRPSPAN